MSLTLGIDLGTTNSCVSILEYGNTEPTVIPSDSGARTTPSIVAFTKDGEVLVGETAKRQAITNADRTISSVKRHMGTDWTISIDKKKYTAQEISARILGKLKKDAEAYLGQEVDSAVITVPAYFNDAQRQATVEAGEIAGLKVLRIINEPTSAALAYGLDKGKEGENVIVYDLGGGTFDVSSLVVSRESDSSIENFTTVEVLATGGDNKLGGDDFDQRIVEYLIKRFKDTTGVDLSKDKIALQRLKEAAEQAKKELSSSMSTDIQLPYLSLTSEGPVNMDEKLTRAKFEELVSDLIEKTRGPLEDVMREAKLTKDNISQAILVGGSSRIPAVIALVRELTGQEPNRSVSPDEIVAIGAADSAAALTGGRSDVLLIDVTPLDLGIETEGGIMTPIIERNTTIPAKRSQTFTTASDSQPAVTVKVSQGQRKFFRDNKSLGTFDLTGIAPAPRGVPQIEVSIDIDANGIVHVSAKDKSTGKEQSIVVSGSSALSKDEIERMVREAEEHAAEDAARKEVAERRNQAEQLVYATEKLLKDNEAALPADVRTSVQSDVDALKRALLGDNNVAVKSAFESLETSQQRIGEVLYAQQQQESPSGTGSQSASNSSEDDVVDAELVED